MGRVRIHHSIMKPEAQRIAIAQACGWTSEFIEGNGLDCDMWMHPSSGMCYHELPDYPNDLNAMHEAEKVWERYDREKWDDYLENLGTILQRDDKPIWVIVNCVRASAAQRAEAFLRTFNLWEETT